MEVRPPLPSEIRELREETQHLEQYWVHTNFVAVGSRLSSDWAELKPSDFSVINESSSQFSERIRSALRALQGVDGVTRGVKLLWLERTLGLPVGIHPGLGVALWYERLAKAFLDDYRQACQQETFERDQMEDEAEFLYLTPLEKGKACFSFLASLGAFEQAAFLEVCHALGIDEKAAEKLGREGFCSNWAKLSKRVGKPLPDLRDKLCWAQKALDSRNDMIHIKSRLRDGLGPYEDPFELHFPSSDLAEEYLQALFGLVDRYATALGVAL